MAYRGRGDAGPRGGAEHLARIHGTEEDKNPMVELMNTAGNLSALDTNVQQASLDDFYEEFHDECKKYGKLEDIQVCENLGDHMVGNVYLKFADEEDAQEALRALNNRYFAGRRMHVEYSPVTDFREARCRQFDEGTCNRGPHCNFMHVFEPSAALRRHLGDQSGFRGGKMKGTGGMDNLYGGGGGRGRDRDTYGSRGSSGRDRDRDRDRDKDRGRDWDRDRDRAKDRDRDRRDRDYGDRTDSRRRKDSRSRSRDRNRDRESVRRGVSPEAMRGDPNAVPAGASHTAAPMAPMG